MRSKKSEVKKCKNCKFAQIPEALAKIFRDVTYVPVECTNDTSKFYGAVLNMTVDGETLRKVTWSGCDKHVLGKTIEYVITRKEYLESKSDGK